MSQLPDNIDQQKRRESASGTKSTIDKNEPPKKRGRGPAKPPKEIAIYLNEISELQSGDTEDKAPVSPSESPSEGKSSSAATTKKKKQSDRVWSPPRRTNPPRIAAIFGQLAMRQNLENMALSQPETKSPKSVRNRNRPAKNRILTIAAAKKSKK